METRGIFDDPAPPGKGRADVQGRTDRTAPPSSSDRRQAWWKAVVVLLLLLAIGTVIAWKVTGRGPGGAAGSGSGTAALAGRYPRSTNFLPEVVVATVGDFTVTVRDVQETLRALPEEVTMHFERRQHELLEELITRRLLVQEARRLRIDETEPYRAALALVGTGAHAEESALIDALLRTQVLAGITVTETDRRDFFARHRQELPQPASFEDWRDRLEPYVRQEKEGEAIQNYIEQLRSGVTIIRNEAWIEAQRAAAAQNPLDEALTSGKPVLADFGQGTCIPCRMMKPFLDELMVELRDQVHVLYLDTRQYGDQAMKYGVRVIPTQIFFDATGRERYRHQGFMSKADIQRKLKELGML